MGQVADIDLMEECAGCGECDECQCQCSSITGLRRHKQKQQPHNCLFPTFVWPSEREGWSVLPVIHLSFLLLVQPGKLLVVHSPTLGSP